MHVDCLVSEGVKVASEHIGSAGSIKQTSAQFDKAGESGIIRVLYSHAYVPVLLFGLTVVPAACAGFPAASGGHGRCREAAG